MRGDDIVPSLVQPSTPIPMREAGTQAREVEQLDNGTDENPVPEVEASPMKSPVKRGGEQQ